jgi:hypothetical protein
MKSFLFTVMLLVATALPARTTELAPPDTLEPIHLFKMTRETLTLGVATSGYTSVQSFRIDVRKGENERFYTMKIIRIKRDEGKMMPQPMEISFKLADLKIDPRYVVRVENPFCTEED